MKVFEFRPSTNLSNRFYYVSELKIGKLVNINCMKKGQKYKLVSFNGTTKPNKNCQPNENYWKLIGQCGILINFSAALNFSNDHRVLIQFELDVEKQGLSCHNPVGNSLWILKTDLEKQ